MPQTSPHLEADPAAGTAALELSRLEFHRHGVALMPSESDKHPAVAYFVDAANGMAGQRFCSCKLKKKTTCHHLKDLSRIFHRYETGLDHPDFLSAFKSSGWYKLVTLLADEPRFELEKLQLVRPGVDGDRTIVVQDQENRPHVFYFSTGPDQLRLIERCSPAASHNGVPTRADALARLVLLTTTADEKVLAEKGFRTARQKLENSFWYRFAYHCHREFDPCAWRLHPFIEESTGDFFLACKSTQSAAAAVLFHILLPRKKVKRVLKELEDILENDNGLSIQPLSMDAVFDATLNEALDLEIQPLHRLIRKNGEQQFFKREDLETYQYGNLFYIKELGILVEDHYPAPRPEYLDPVRTLVEKSRVPYFLADHGDELKQPLFRLDTSVQQLKIIDTFDQAVIRPDALEQDWCWLSMDYGQGDVHISLADIIQAKLDGQRYLAAKDGWVDCQADQFAYLDDLILRKHRAPTVDGQRIRLLRSDLLRISTMERVKLLVEGEASKISPLKKLLDLSPSNPLPSLTGLTSRLRAYQQRGVEWLWFLYENHLGGLLCDDMGLGKTHQFMAFMVALRQFEMERSESGRPEKDRRPFLVVCPTSVISHWQQKIGEHAPGLAVTVYHGNDRDIDQLGDADVVITTYGILFRDVAALSQTKYAVIAFDEMHQLKNPATKAYAAAGQMQAEMKIGLTGTPIENHLQEMKALFDLTLPGYLGADADFKKQYQIPIEEMQDSERRKKLSRMVAPFTLRRLKTSVLEELPEKIEDFRMCRLSEEQVKLYRDAVNKKGRQVIATLMQADQPIPYLHVFSLLTLLKQICNHPALVANDPTDYGQYASGKWDLFTELLSQVLDSGQKVVVYSQYVGMIEIIRQYLIDQGLAHATLTGATRNRGAIIQRFREDADCRVFVGSLKAAGLGIDLVSASVVIHYDRWWNASREDQATDRVHRIGQTRGVQVFKLITQGTLEEKIAAIIAKKRDLMNDIVKEDDPDLIKTFSRDHLLEMLSLPEFREYD